MTLNEKMTKQVDTTMQGNIANKANESLIQQYLEIVMVTDDMEHFSQLIADDCVWVMMPTGHAFKGYAQVSSLAKWPGEQESTMTSTK